MRTYDNDAEVNMDLHVKGEAPEGGSHRVPFEGWVVATAFNPKSEQAELLVSDESSGDTARRLRWVPVISVDSHRLSTPERVVGADR